MPEPWATFAQKSAPPSSVPPLVVSSFDETKTNVNYPKDLRGTVLMCLLATPAHRQCLCGVDGPRLLSRRKNTTLRMSYRAPDDPCKVVATEKINYKGKPSSDVTKGFEKIYERSYY